MVASPSLLQMARAASLRMCSRGAFALSLGRISAAAHPFPIHDSLTAPELIRSQIVVCVSSCIRQPKELLSCLECCTAQTQWA